MSEWQDISTHSKKPFEDILGFEDGYGIQITYFRPESEDYEEGYRTPRHGWSPTHWMPLPNPPANRGDV